MENLLVLRGEAKGRKDFARADAIRDGFAAAGIELKDTADGASWKVTARYDLAKLRELL